MPTRFVRALAAKDLSFMKKQTLITRNLVNISVDHVLSFKSEKAFQEAMEAEGHFDNELPGIREQIVESIWKEAKELSAAEEAATKAENSGNAKATAKAPTNTNSETGAPGGGPASATTAPSGSGTTTTTVK